MKETIPKYFIQTFGCQMNENDSERIAGILNELGYTSVEAPEEADLIIINTCSVRDTADNRALGNLGSIKTLKKKNPNLVLAVCGCMMQQEPVVEMIKQKHPQVDLIFGTHNINELPQLLEKQKETKKRVVKILKEQDKFFDLPVAHKYPFKSYVTIMQGCNNFCSYCIVPYTRGREKSRDSESILKEIRELVKNGTLEVTLLGQNVNSYGNDLKNGDNFAKLLRQVNEIEGLKRIRFMSSNPKDFTDEVISAMKESDKVMPSLHLALQSGSSRILKKMNRHYTKEEAIDLVKKIKEEIPGIAITTDIIVGFPGETEEDFQDTLDLLRQCDFDNAFSFIYSKRPGTVAATMPEQIPKEVKSERIGRVLDLLEEQARGKNEKFLGETTDVLFEEVSQKDKSKISGRTPEGKLVHVKTEPSVIGKILPVKIIETGSYSMIGELI